MGADQRQRCVQPTLDVPDLLLHRPVGAVRPHPTELHSADHPSPLPPTDLYTFFIHPAGRKHPLSSTAFVQHNLVSRYHLQCLDSVQVSVGSELSAPGHILHWRRSWIDRQMGRVTSVEDEGAVNPCPPAEETTEEPVPAGAVDEDDAMDAEVEDEVEEAARTMGRATSTALYRVRVRPASPTTPTPSSATPPTTIRTTLCPN
jgi:hypothetical protein